MSRSIRFIATGTLLSLAMSALPAFAAFSDVSSSQFKTAIDALQNNGIIDGYSDGSFKPDANINRAEFLKIILEARGGEFDGSDCFPDVNGEWFAKYVCTAKQEEIIAGYPDGSFKPEQNITMVEASKILSLAFKVDAGNGVEWYEPYMRALESSKAIPVTVKGLTKLVTRGEMAEMLWRLTEKKTDQPAIGYLNVKYPDMKINLASNQVQRATSCNDLRAFTEEARSGGNMYMDKAEGMPPPVAAPGLQSGGRQSVADDYSQTNVQVAGVDEADIVKTDGEYVYMIKGQTVRIIKARPASDMREVAMIDMTKDNMNPTELYIDGSTLVVMGSVYDNYNYPYPTIEPMPNVKMFAPIYLAGKTQVRTYNVTNKASPSLIRTVEFEGNMLSSRRIENKLYVVLNQNLWPYPILREGQSTDQIVPMFKDSARGNKNMPVADCTDIRILPRVPSPQYLIVGVISLNNSTAEVQREVILGSAQNIYASLKNLYVSAPEWNYNWDARGGTSDVKTTIYRFAFTDSGIELKSQGQVPGMIKNQFSMDEADTTLRITTTIPESWQWDTQKSTPSKNNLYVLSLDMKQVGSVENIAPGETIYSTRFVGERAYVVTFKKIDPFFVIDLSDERNPKILGKLKIPGYSDYLHPYDEDHVIGFGKEATESKTGDFAWYQGMKIAIFDVSDVANPKELHNTVIGDRGTDSPLLTNHKALLFDKSRNLLAFPVTVNKIPDNLKEGNDGSAYGTPVFQGAYVYDLTLKNGFKLKGTITHYDSDSFTKAGDYWYGDGRNIDRILRLSDSLVTVSQDELQSHTSSNLKDEGSVTLK